MNTLAIDGSTKATGIAVFRDKQLIYYDCLYETSTDTIKRILSMANRIKDICVKYSIEQIVMEDVLPEDVKHNDNTYTPLKYLQAAVVFVTHSLGVPVEFKTASWWRSRCGIKTGPGIKRNTLKAKSIETVRLMYDIDTTDDIADAICLGVAYIDNMNLQPYNWE